MSWDKTKMTWRASLRASGKLHNSSCFACEETAARTEDDCVRQQGLEQARGLNLPTPAEAAKCLHVKKDKCSHSTSSRLIGVGLD